MISKPHKCIAILAKNVTLTVDGNHHYQTALLFHNSCTFTEKLKGELTRADGPAVASGGAGGATFRCEVSAKARQVLCGVATAVRNTACRLPGSCQGGKTAKVLSEEKSCSYVWD